jgi:hypothetical protein
VIKATYPRLAEADVTAGALMARAAGKDGKPGGHPVRLHGLPRLGVARVTNARERACGLPDVLGGDRWGGLSAAQRAGLIDSLLARVEPAGGADGSGRPRVRQRRTDFEVFGTWDVIERHQIAAPEAAEFIQAVRTFRQRQLPFEWE